MKVKVRTVLAVEGKKIVHEEFGIFSNQKLIFLEQDVKVLLNFRESVMIRDDSVKKLVYKFIENEETLNEVFLKEEKFSVYLKIFTKKYVCLNTSCEIIYRLLDEDQDVFYQVNWEEV